MGGNRNQSINQSISFLIALFVLLTFFFLSVESTKASLWMDDMAQLSMVGRGVRISSFLHNILWEDNNPPLSHLIYAVWLRVAPYGNFWAKLPNILFVIVGSVTLCQVARRIYGDHFGIVVLIISLTNASIIRMAAFTARPYGLLYMMSAFLLLIQYVRYSKYTIKTNVIFGIVLLLLAYTHYFGCIMIFASLLCDIVRVVRKKVKPTSLLAYLSIIAYIPWVKYASQKYLEQGSGFWPHKPDLMSIPQLLRELCGDSPITWVLLVLFLVMFTVRLKHDSHYSEYYRWNVFVLVFTVMSVFVYSAYINPTGSLWVSRYFLCISPVIMLLASLAIFVSLDELSITNTNRIIVLLVLLIFVVIHNVESIHSRPYFAEEKYEQAANYIMSTEDIYNPDVAIFCSNYAAHEGWSYYLTHNGQRPGKAAFFKGEIAGAEQFENINVIYYFRVHSDPDEKMSGLLNSEFHQVYTDPVSGVVRYERNQ